MKFNIKKIKDFFKQHSHFVIAVHKSPDGDALSSALGMAVILKKMKKKYRIVNQDTIPTRYEFFLNRYIDYMVPEFSHIPHKTKFNVMLSNSFLPNANNSALIVLDSSNIYRTGHFAEELKQFSSILNIDHHDDNTRFGTLNFINPKASATAEILYELIMQWRIALPSVFYELIYIGIAMDTGFFSQRNATNKTLSLCSELLKKKIDIVGLNSLLRQQKLKLLRIQGRVLSRIQIDGPLVWSYITLTDMKKWGIASNDTEIVTEAMSGIEEANIILVFKQISSSKVKISFRSQPEFNVLPIAKKFGGGGHFNAAGCERKGALKDVISEVVAYTKKTLRGN